MVIQINSINSLFDAINYFEKIINASFDTKVSIDFTNSSFVRNHYLSIIGMSIEILKTRNNDIQILKPNNQKVLDSMNDIGFLPAFCDEKEGYDTHKTMIKYTHIPIKEYDLELQRFYVYFMQQFKGKIENLSPLLLKKILQKFFELFSNVFRHSQSGIGFFCSGQFYPKNDKFNFTIVDNGITIRRNVNRYLLKKHGQQSLSDRLFSKKFQPLNGLEAIKWALIDNHSTTGSGGLGLSLLLDLVTISGGNIEILSGNGYFSMREGESEILDSSFEGTIISVELITKKDKYYFLKEENHENN